MISVFYNTIRRRPVRPLPYLNPMSATPPPTQPAHCNTSGISFLSLSLSLSAGRVATTQTGPQAVRWRCLSLSLSR